MREPRVRYHPDRLRTMIELSRCCFMQGKVERAIAVCDEAVFGLEVIGERPHTLAVGMRKARAGMAAMREGGGVEREVVFPFILFRVSED